MLRHRLSTVALMILVTGLSGCAALSQLGPKYQRDSVDDLHDKAMQIQGVFTEANRDLLRIHGRLVAILDEVDLKEAGDAVRDAMSALSRLKELPAQGKELLGIGQALLTKAPTQYVGPQALDLPKKLALLKEAVGILAGLGDQVLSLAESGEAVIACGSALISGGDRAPCEDTSLAELDAEPDVGIPEDSAAPTQESETSPDSAAHTQDSGVSGDVAAP